MLKLLIVEGNTRETREQTRRKGQSTQSGLYIRVLESLGGRLACTIAYPADEDAALPKADELKSYDGIVWTGSALNIYDGGPAIEQQINFMKVCFETGTRMFGSCWGLQVATVALGGVVAANEKGREIGIARKIVLTEAGAVHPLYRGKAPVFDAVAVHLDHVVDLPVGARVLASNAMSQIQAFEITTDNSVFWGVQYHPEFDLDYIAGIILKYGAALVDEGLCKSQQDVEAWAGDLQKVGGDPSNADLIAKHDLRSDVTDCSVRLLELSNWLTFLGSGEGSHLSTSQASELT